MCVCVLLFALGHESSWHGRRYSNYLGLFENQNRPIYPETFQWSAGLQFCFTSTSTWCPPISLGHFNGLEATTFKEAGTCEVN